MLHKSWQHPIRQAGILRSAKYIYTDSMLSAPLSTFFCCRWQMYSTIEYYYDTAEWWRACIESRLILRETRCTKSSVKRCPYKELFQKNNLTPRSPRVVPSHSPLKAKLFQPWYLIPPWEPEGARRAFSPLRIFHTLLNLSV